MPQISNFYGIVIYMYINEHNPPHFHVEYQGYKATVTIENGIVTGCMNITLWKRITCSL